MIVCKRTEVGAALADLVEQESVSITNARTLLAVTTGQMPEHCVSAAEETAEAA